MLVNIIYLLLAVIATGVIGFVVFYVLSGKKPWFFKLNNAVNEKLDQVDGLVKEGDEGYCLSGLRPMGKAMISGNEYEVTSNGEYVEENSPIKVIRVIKNKITVSKII